MYAASLKFTVNVVLSEDGATLLNSGPISLRETVLSVPVYDVAAESPLAL